MDDPFVGDDRQHKSWRDLPPTPPLVWPTTAPAFATAAVGASAAPMPTTEASTRPRRRLVVGTALLVGAIAVVGTGVIATGSERSSLSEPARSPAIDSGRCWRRSLRPVARPCRTRWQR